MRRLIRALLVVAGLRAVLATAAPARSADPLDLPGFTADPQALRALAAALPADDAHPVTVLRDEATYTLDAQGRCVTRIRVVFHAATQAAAEGWADLENEWSPWFEERPEVRARVIAADGSVHVLDPKTIAEAPARDSDPALYGNRRVLRVPLPAMAAGVVVEEEILTRETQPEFAAGIVRRHGVARAVPVRSMRLLVDAPEGLPLRYATYAGAPEPVRTVANGRVRLQVSAGPLAALENLEPGAPERQTPSVAFATGESWQKVAAAYEQVVAAQIGNTTLGSLVKTLVTRADSARTVAAKLLKRLQHDVRYTGVEFDEATLVPRRPAETLQRRYGDCKDKAALLVALLEAAGVPASVALLSTGPGPDVDPALPGVGEFNHAIVHVGGADPFWIDPTAEFARAGELPSEDRGRLALVAHATSTGLVKTPEAQPSDSVTVETREFFLSESGGARVVETSEWSGQAEAGSRDQFARGKRKELQEQLGSYVKEEYLARKEPVWETSDPADLGAKFRLRLEVAEANRGYTDPNEALVVLFPPRLLQSLPPTLSAASDEEDAEQDAPRSRPARKPRTRDYVLATPFVTEWRVKVVPPPGYGPLALPEAKTTPVGTGKLVQEYAADPDGTVRATLRFESGPRRVTAAQVETWRKDAEALGRSEAVYLRFEQTGAAHLRQGHVREALAEFRRLAALHPKEARHRSQVAMALLQGGLGEPARAEAKEGIRIEPASARAHATLGWILEHDLIGRRFGKGWDRAGAIAELRKAKELDPKDAAARADLAILLEHDGEGRRYAPGSSLAEAVAEYRALRKDLKEKRYDVNLVIALLWTRDFAALAQTAKEVEPSAERTQALVLAATMLDSPEAGLREATRLVGDLKARRDTLQRVGTTLVQLREYPKAAVLLSEAAAGADNEAQLRATLDQIRRTKRRDQLPPPGDDPVGLLQRMLNQVVAGSADSAESRALFAKALQSRWEKEKGSLDAARRMIAGSGVPSDAVLDLSLAAVEFPTEGSEATGWRVTMRGAAGSRSVSETYYVTREEGRCRIAATGRALSDIGWEARRRAAAGDLAGARQWLDWAREPLRAPSPDDPYDGPAFARLWTRGAAGDEAKVRRAAAALLAPVKEDTEGVGVLEAERTRAEGEERDAVEHALAVAYLSRDRWSDADGVLKALRGRHPDSDVAFLWSMMALRHLDRVDEARALCDARLARKPADPVATRELAQLELSLERYREAMALGRGLLASGQAEAEDYNNAAWGALFTGDPIERALDEARRAVEMTRRGSFPSLHTLASLLAESGRAAEAREVILQAIDLHEDDAPIPADWYVFGRIAELYGERGAAAAAYAKVGADDKLPREGGSTRLLAKRRMAALKGTSPG